MSGIPAPFSLSSRACVASIAAPPTAENGRLQFRCAYAIGSILPPMGISGAVLLSVMTMSYLPLSRSRH